MRQPSKSSPTLASSPDDQAQLVVLLTQCYDALKVYGKEPEQLPNLIKMFILVLGEYDFATIRKAFTEYLKRRNEMPAPADIVNIIDPPPEPLSAATYVSLQKKAYSGEYLMRDEREFCEAFRRQEFAKTRGGSDELREADREIAQFKLSYDGAAHED